MSASVSSPATARVRMEKPPRWLELDVSLDHEWNGGRFIHSRSSAVNLQPADDRSRTYDLETWESGIASGAFYAYRELNRPRRRITVNDLQGLVSSEDMTALASATALAVARLLGGNLPNIDLAGWKVVSLGEKNASQSP